MSALLFNYGGFNAQGTEMKGVGISQEQSTFGTEVAPNGVTGTPAQIQAAILEALNNGASVFALKR